MILLCAIAGLARAEDIVNVSPALWDRPRSARAVLDLPAVRQVLDQYLARPGARLAIHHGYGQEAQLQAEELRMWLMALAVDGARVSLINDARANETLKLEITK
jgi:hypothetical protein